MSWTKVNVLMDETRYARHALIDWFDQDRLRAARIAVIGAGAVGNEVVKNLALLGVGAIEIFDFDRIERHNLTRWSDTLGDVELLHEPGGMDKRNADAFEIKRIRKF